VLGPLESDAVNRALNKLYHGQGTRLWVVYVKNFGGLKPLRWAEDTMRANGFTDIDAILAIATDEPAFSLRVPAAATNGKPSMSRSFAVTASSRPLSGANGPERR
jgi:serine/threonine-protein kinase